jgi:hypothetical protein
MECWSIGVMKGIILPDLCISDLYPTTPKLHSSKIPILQYSAKIQLSNAFLGQAYLEYA